MVTVVFVCWFGLMRVCLSNGDQLTSNVNKSGETARIVS